LLEEVVRHVDVRPAVAVQVADRNAQPEADLAPEDPRRFAHVHEAPVIISVEPVAARRIANLAGVLDPHAVRWTEGVVDHIQIQIAVAIVVEERRMRRIALIRYAEGGGRLLEFRDAPRIQALVDVELVRPPLSFHIPGIRDIDVEPAIRVEIHKGDARGPGSPPFDPCLSGHVSESEAAVVQKESVLPQVRGQQQLGKTVAGEVPQRHAASVVEVAVREDVEVGAVDDPILESNASITGGEQGEEPVSGRGRLTR
jgi:hypothetical protein